MVEQLEDGWRSTTPDDDTIIRRFVLSNAERVAWTAEQLGGTVVRRDDAVLADWGTSVVFDNSVVLLAVPGHADLDAIVDTARSIYGGRPWLLTSALPVPDLAARGMKLMGHPPSMLRPAGGAPPAPPEGLRVVEVHDEGALSEWNETFTVAFPSPGGHRPIYDRRHLGGPLRFWIGYEGDRPVATSAAYLSHDVIDVEFVSSMPDVRGRGYGEAITWAATLADPAQPAMLIASDSGRPVYEHMGYLPLLRFTLWYED